MIVFVGGLIGAGKSTVARSLAEHYSLHYYDVDEIKKRIFKEDPNYDHHMSHGVPFGDEIRSEVYKAAVEDLKELSHDHQCIVVDETLHKKAMRHYLFDAADTYFGGYFVIWVKADESVVAKRLTGSVREGHILKDPMAMHNSMLAEFDGFERSVLVCRNNHSIDATMEDITRFLASMSSFSQLTERSD